MWQRRRLARLDLICLGANPNKLGTREIPAVSTPALTAEQQTELYRLNYKQRTSTLAPAEAVLRARLAQIARRGK
jgi:hypothetical protein